ncbi:hypothetical protein OC710_02010, partial ['Vigna radiata' phytoplasma]|nr:hypothetical protein ['Vigna radiata' phytoplasma]
KEMAAKVPIIVDIMVDNKAISKVTIMAFLTDSSCVIFRYHLKPNLLKCINEAILPSFSLKEKIIKDIIGR